MDLSLSSFNGFLKWRKYTQNQQFHIRFLKWTYKHPCKIPFVIKIDSQAKLCWSAFVMIKMRTKTMYNDNHEWHAKLNSFYIRILFITISFFEELSSFWMKNSFIRFHNCTSSSLQTPKRGYVSISTYASGAWDDTSLIFVKYNYEFFENTTNIKCLRKNTQERHEKKLTEQLI